jgi:hypothetical protein
VITYSCYCFPQVVPRFKNSDDVMFWLVYFAGSVFYLCWFALVASVVKSVVFIRSSCYQCLNHDMLLASLVASVAAVDVRFAS